MTIASTQIPILLTSFTTWRADQVSNASDDLLALVEKQAIATHLKMLRQLPVDTPRATEAVVGAIYHHRPRYAICCGMAESRRYLELERQAKCKEETLQTTLDLPWLTASLLDICISNDAGIFVCNGLYYNLLKHLGQTQLDTCGLFIHVPILTDVNRVFILSNFCMLLEIIIAQSLSRTD
jgi:pyroglutamyl-peptidase